MPNTVIWQLQQGKNQQRSICSSREGEVTGGIEGLHGTGMIKVLQSPVGGTPPGVPRHEFTSKIAMLSLSHLRRLREPAAAVRTILNPH